MIATPSDRTNSFDGLHTLDLTPSFKNPSRQNLAISSEVPHHFRLNFHGNGMDFSILVETEDPDWLVPVWLNDLVQKSASILRLQENWDSYGASPINPAVVWSAIELVLRVSSRKTTKPSIIPINSGGVQVEWHLNDVDLEIEIPVPGYFNVLFDDNSGNEWEKRLQMNNLQELEAVIENLTE